MTLTVSLVALFGLVLFFLLRSKTLGWGSAFIAAMFGFFLASTGASGPINELTAAVVAAIPDL
ncbi:MULTISPECIES: hypothetical protein [Streptomyces]|uniref:GntP family permease n=1 Tax=Streptomyces pakalii TaxID=3036494 RepID=A0ABT7DF64_9ACTN|nr:MULTISPECIES: hypothetical protein [Streptomyces]MCX4602384.1 hypothetical protein [Streptomyces anulatus]MDJ1643592.1 hypothetical protein [Streptomyces pakalii]WEH40912.1 hypothetical protein PZB77_16115 [Streptomyces sp. AM 2-1-1]WST54528.1 hypothetical protein OG475_17495 [Streptomyces rubiginosohelvolus]